MKILKNIVLTIIILSIILGLAYFLYNTYNKIEVTPNYETSKLNSTSSEQILDTRAQESSSVANMLENISKCVVGISKLKTHSNSIFSNNSISDLGIGTGVIISDNGYILSNCHVTGEALSSCYITLENGYTYDGSVVWCDSDLDLSITKINASNLPFVTLGDSSSLKAGETVYAIGNPIGYEFRRTITSGIISAVNRTIKIEENNSAIYMTDLLQTDASINPGNSGGPLVLSNGQVVGINSVKITSAEGIGFAVPINVIKPVIQKFIADNKFNEAYLGIYAYDKNVIPYVVASSNISSGLYIVQIADDSPAASSGIKSGDIITSIDGVSFNNMNELREFVFSKSPNDVVSVEISRGYITRKFEITLGTKR